jgi:hypothetical protein
MTFHKLLALNVRSEASTALSAIRASFSASSVSRRATILLGGGRSSSSKAHAMFQQDVVLVTRSLPVLLEEEATATAPAWLSRSR